jgi:hypothetical protein
MPLVAPARLIPIAKSVSEMSLTTYPSRQPSATSAAPDKQRVAMQRGARPPRLPTLEPSNARVASASRSRSRRRRFSGVGRRALVLGPPSGPPSVGRGPARRGACAAHPGTCRVQPSGGPAPPPGNAPPGPAIAPPLAGGEQTPCLRVGERRHCLVSRVVAGSISLSHRSHTTTRSRWSYWSWSASYHPALMLHCHKKHQALQTYARVASSRSSSNSGASASRGFAAASASKRRSPSAPGSRSLIQVGTTDRRLAA